MDREVIYHIVTARQSSMTTSPFHSSESAAAFPNVFPSLAGYLAGMATWEIT